MGYVSSMIVRLLDDNNFVEESDKAQIYKDFEASLKKGSDKKIPSAINAGLNHPVGALLLVGLYGLIRSWLNRITLRDSNVSMEERYKMQFKEQIMQEMLENND